MFKLFKCIFKSWDSLAWWINKQAPEKIAWPDSMQVRTPILQTDIFPAKIQAISQVQWNQQGSKFDVQLGDSCYFQEKINADRHKQSQSPGSAPGNPSSAPPRTPTLQFLSDSSISHQTQIGLGESKVIHFHSRCTAQGWGGDEAGREIMKWEQQPVQEEQRKQRRERSLRWSRNKKTPTKPKKINSKQDEEWIVFVINQSHQTTIPTWKPTQPETVLVVSFHSKF